MVGPELTSTWIKIWGQGHRIRTERTRQTPGGNKESRRPDITYRTPDGQERGTNIGRTRADGITPVTREQRALDDLNGPGNLPTNFIPYDAQ
jgi:hypothetical protein